MTPTTFWTAVEFLSTLSLRRATDGLLRVHEQLEISIHALLAESDSRRNRGASAKRNFYPRSPCGERPVPDTWRA